MKTWEAFGGISAVEAGKRRNGKPRLVLLTTVYVCMSAADAKAMTKQHPQLKFVELTRKDKATELSSTPRDDAEKAKR